MSDLVREWIGVFSWLQREFRRGEWYRVQDAELSEWSKTMQRNPPLAERN